MFERSDKFVRNKFGRQRLPKGKRQGCRESVFVHAIKCSEFLETRQYRVPFCLVRLFWTSTNSSGTNLDAGSAQRVSDMDVTNPIK